MMTMFTPEGSQEALEVGGVIPVTHTGASGMFVGIFVGLAATELFIKLSNNKSYKFSCQEISHQLC